MEPATSDCDLHARKRSVELANGSGISAEKLSPLNGGSSVSQLVTADLLAERRALVLWRRPLTTLYYFVCELLIVLRSYGMR